MKKSLDQILGEQTAHGDHTDNLLSIAGMHDSVCLIAIDCFNYGVMIGKREERLRRKLKNKKLLEIESKLRQDEQLLNIVDAFIKGYHSKNHKTM